MNRTAFIRFLLLFALAMALPFVGKSQTFKAWMNAGNEAFGKGSYAEAIEYYKKAVEFETGDRALDYRLAESYRLYKDYEKAEAWYTKVFGSDESKSYPLALFYMAEMKKYNAKYEDACRLFGDYVKQYASDTGYFTTKAKSESGYCGAINEIINKKETVAVTNAGTAINSKYSDFGASNSGDSTLHYASLRFLYEPKSDKHDPYYVARILKADMISSSKQKPAALGILVNDPPLHNASACFSPDQRLSIFARCQETDSTGKQICKLYYSTLNGGKWSKPVLIQGGVNSNDQYTSTQPSIEARGAMGYTLYFISDRPGGYGKLDVWKSDIDAAMRFGEPVNLGNTINTFDDEMTPYFDTRNGTLYFSSYGHAGIGGMDIFRSKMVSGVFSNPENLGRGLNSSHNDVYFTINNHNEKGTLTSNRTGSQFIGSKTCCYDIYFHEPLKQDTIPVAVIDSVPNDELSKKDPGKSQYYEDFLPLRLYFDNDEPDKKTLAVTTNKSYDNLYRDYVGRIPEYKSRYGGGSIDKQAAEMAIDTFFTNVVTKSWDMLNGFCAKVETAMQKGIQLELEIRGRASPLAETAYNVNLSRRRISSLLNYMKKYNNGTLKPYFESGQLRLTEVPAGESLALSNVSDNREDQRNSVYNPNAAKERLIELIGVKIKQAE
ncbi:MAG: tetratricopeptide repeat protein [Bacteroidota bacterium]